MKSLQIIIINIIVLAAGLLIGWGGNYLTNTIDIDTYSVLFDLFIIIAGGGTLVFLVWHITNHLPMQIKELKNKIDNNQKETKKEIGETKKEIGETKKEINNKIDNNHKETKEEIKEVRQEVKGLQKIIMDIYKLLSGTDNKKDK